MANLFSKHFGDKVFLDNLNEKIADKILKAISQTNRRRSPRFGHLNRFEDGTVGLFIWYIGKNGQLKLVREPTTHKTIFSWAKFHQSQ